LMTETYVTLYFKLSPHKTRELLLFAIKGYILRAVHVSALQNDCEKQPKLVESDE
jgi:hypothetical protein